MLKLAAVSLTALSLAVSLAVPATTEARRHHRHAARPAPLTITTEGACLADERNQWITEYLPTGTVGGCERIGPHKERPVTVELLIAL